MCEIDAENFENLIAIDKDAINNFDKENLGIRINDKTESLYSKLKPNESVN